MNILDIIAKKRDSKELTKQEIEYFVAKKKSLIVVIRDFFFNMV